MDNVRITHEGVITDISDTTAEVEILSKSACAACHAKAVCSASDEQVKIIEVPLTITSLSSHFQKGDRVLVILSSSLGPKAVFYAYGIPLVLLLVAMLTASACGLTELYVGLCGIGVVIFYYLVLAFFKDKLSKVFTFSIEKIQ